MAMLRADSIAFDYKNRKVLRGIYLRLDNGEIVGMVGRNGCGKTTLLRILHWQLRTRTGTVIIDGALCSQSARWRHVAMLPQHSFLPRELTLRRAARLYAGRRGVSIIREHERTRELLDQRTDTLSGGERRFAEFLLVLALERPFVFLDEPFSKIEPLYVQLIFDELLRRSNTGVLITDHNYRDVRRICTRLISLIDGTMADVGSSDNDLRSAGYLPEA